MGSVVSRLRQLSLGDLDSALDPDAYRPKLETEFNTPESKSITRIQLPDPRSISQGIDRTPLFAFVKKDEMPGIENSTPLRSKTDDQKEERNISVSTLPKRLLETNLDDSHCEEVFEDQLEAVEIDVLINPEDVYYPDESNDPQEVTYDEAECSMIPNVTEEIPSCVIDEVVEESTEPEEFKEGSPPPQVTSGIDLLSMRQNLFTTPQQQSIKCKRVPLGFVCPNTKFETVQENVLLTTNTNDKNWKSVADERYRLGLTASSDPENTPPSVLRLTEPPEVVQSAPGKFRNSSRRRFESKNSPGLFI